MICLVLCIRILYQRCFLKLLNEENWTCSSKHRLAWRLKRLIEITGDLDNMLHLAGLQRGTKIKRGLFDFVGEISKTLFGTLAERMRVITITN